ncbi:LOW QUALITY PROTEIN: hypothetical protein M514_17284 [Trichuris suis]|uniref:CCHC-type domain-containing protein n=1 Tax=Trichuris suis TaxID=68888 RepID=A0A085NLZ5_9BILA|nr:LOW QUALITY PROTEIN: hypothetical protein M514_17284 [Trichuris suis]
MSFPGRPGETGVLVWWQKALACAFVAGLPDSVRQLLRAGSRLENLGLDQILARARAVLVDERPAGVANACLGARPSEEARQTVVSGPCCYACGGPNHFARDCLTRRQIPGGNRPSGGQTSQPRVRNRGRRRSGAAASPHQGNADGEEVTAAASLRRTD